MGLLTPGSVAGLQDRCYVSVSPTGREHYHSVGLAFSGGVDEETRQGLLCLGSFLTCGWRVPVLTGAEDEANCQHFQGHFHRAESLYSSSAS